MKVAILGAGGIIAPAIVRDLAESEEAEELLLMDLDAGRAQAVADAHGAGKSTVRAVDATVALERSLKGADVLINAASYRVNISAMRASLAAGCHYIDLGGLYHVTGEQLALDDEFRRAGLLALLGMGSSPGKTNVMAAHAVTTLGGHADAIDVLAAGRDLDPPPGESFPYSPRTLVDELTMAPMVLREGKPEPLAPMSDAGVYEFPEPIGTAQTIYTLHSEVRTFGESFGCRQCSFRLALAPPVLERVRSLISASDAQIEAAARAAAPPSPQTISTHVVVASAGDRSLTIAATTRPIEGWGLGGGVVSTGAPAAAAMRLLARGKITARGALPPEGCVMPDDLYAELEQRNCRFEIREAVIR